MVNEGGAGTGDGAGAAFHCACSWVRQLLFVAATVLYIGLLGGCSGFVDSVKSTTTHTAFQLGASSLNFGNVSVGKQSTQTVTISNTGNTSVSITQVTFSNPQFSLPGAAFPMSLATGQTTSLTVAVTPTTSGSVTGTMTVQGSGGSSPVSMTLSATGTAVGPQISLSSKTVHFGTVSISSADDVGVVISNAGSSDLRISVISVSGVEFGVAGIATPKTISPGQSATMTLTFQPSATGGVSGSVAFTSNDPTNPTATIEMDGTGSGNAAGQLQANPLSLTFGNISTGTSSAKQVTLTNTGTGAVVISGVTASGAGFSANGIAFPYTVNPSEAVSLTAIFAPTAAGAVGGNITVNSNGGGGALIIPVSGTGAQSGLTISPTSFNYGSVVDGQTQSQTFTLSNNGNASLAISQLTVSGAAYSVTGFSGPTILAPGGSTTVNAVFAPTTAGSLAGTITVSSTAPNSPATISLSGTGAPSSVTVSANPTSLAFGNVNAGSSSTKSISLTNTGNANVTISHVTVGAKDVSETGVTLPLTLTPGQTQTMNVSFSPTAAESVSGNITLTNSQGGNTVVSVTGTGLQPAINLTPSSAAFGNVAIGATNSQTIQISNMGNATLTITQAIVTGAGFSTGGLSLPLSINPGQSSTFNVQFDPSGTGSVSGSISIASNASGSPSVITLSGTGIAATETLSFSTTSVSFGNVDTGSSSTQSETITNTGNSNVRISQIALSGVRYSLGGASTPVTLSPSQTLSFSIIFTPTAAGSVNGSVTVTSNAAGSPATVALSGTGVQATPHTVALSWTASTSTVSGYNVYRSTTSGSGYARLNGSLVANVNYTDSTVENSTTYYYVTTAVDASGDESAYSNEASAVIP